MFRCRQRRERSKFKRSTTGLTNLVRKLFSSRLQWKTKPFKAFNEAGIRGEDGKFRFVYFSGEGANQEGSKFLFGRVKVRKIRLVQ